MSDPVLDSLFTLASGNRDIAVRVSFTYHNLYIIPGHGDGISGAGEGHLSWFAAQVVTHKVGELTFLDTVPARLYGPVSYEKNGSPGQYETTLQISAPRIELLPASSPYAVLVGANPGPLNGNSPVYPTGQTGQVAGICEDLQLILTLTLP